MLNKKEIKEKMEKILSKKGFNFIHKRVSTICRARINRLSYKLSIDHSIFLEREERKIYIERNPNINVGDGFGTLLYKRAFALSNEILEELKDDIEEFQKQKTVCSN